MGVVQRHNEPETQGADMNIVEVEALPGWLGARDGVVTLQRDSLQKVRAALAASRIGTIWVDLRGGALVVDDIAAHMLGADSPASLTTLDAMKANVAADDRAALDLALQRAIEGS